MKWPVDVLAKPFRPLMEAQVTIELAGGIAEAIYRGERRTREVLAFARAYCNVDVDLERARAVLSDLLRLMTYDFVAQDFAERTLGLLLDNWPAVEALATALAGRLNFNAYHAANATAAIRRPSKQRKLPDAPKHTFRTGI